MQISTMIESKTKNVLRDALIEECKNTINNIITMKNENKNISFYSYSPKAVEETCDKIKREIDSRKMEIKTLNNLMIDWMLLTSKEVDKMTYEEFVNIELSYSNYKTTI